VSPRVQTPILEKKQKKEGRRERKREGEREGGKILHNKEEKRASR
jgi:hypothetical protein